MPAPWLRLIACRQAVKASFHLARSQKPLKSFFVFLCAGHVALLRRLTNAANSRDEIASLRDVSAPESSISTGSRLTALIAALGVGLLGFRPSGHN